MKWFHHKFYTAMVIAALSLPAVVRAGVIVDASVSGTTGAYYYAYEVENQTDVGLLLLSLTLTGDVGTMQSPTGWVPTTTVLAPGETLVEWISTDVPFDVPALGTLSGFSFTSDSGPGTVAFSTFDENFTEFDGQTTGPVASTVPDPNSLALLGTALIGIYIRRRWTLGKSS